MVPPRTSHAVVHLVVQADHDVLQHRLVVEQADVLEGAGDAGPVDLGGGHAVDVLAVQQDGAVGGLVDLGQQVEDGGLAGAVGADEAGDLRAAQGNVEVVHGLEAAEGDAQVDALEDGRLVGVALGQVVDAGDGDQRRALDRGGGAVGKGGEAVVVGYAQGVGGHCPVTSSFLALGLLSFSRMPAIKPLRMGLLVASITRISTMA